MVQNYFITGHHLIIWTKSDLSQMSNIEQYCPNCMFPFFSLFIIEGKCFCFTFSEASAMSSVMWLHMYNIFTQKKKLIMHQLVELKGSIGIVLCNTVNCHQNVNNKDPIACPRGQNMGLWVHSIIYNLILHYMHCTGWNIMLLTHWPLGDLDAILKPQFSFSFYWLVSSHHLRIMPWDECHGTSLNIGSAITWANVDLVIYHHMASPGHNKLMMRLQWDLGPFIKKQ